MTIQISNDRKNGFYFSVNLKWFSCFALFRRGNIINIICDEDVDVKWLLNWFLLYGTLRILRHCLLVVHYP